MEGKKDGKRDGAKAKGKGKTNGGNPKVQKVATQEKEASTLGAAAMQAGGSEKEEDSSLRSSTTSSATMASTRTRTSCSGEATSPLRSLRAPRSESIGCKDHV